MKMTRYLGGVISFVSLAGLFAACADKDQQDWRNDQSAQRLAQLEPTRGTYTGKVTSVVDGTDLGVMKLTLTPSTKVQTAGDGIGTETTPVIEANLTYTDPLIQSTVASDQGQYDPSTGIFKASFPLVDISNNSYNFVVQGVVSSSGIVGTTSVETFPNFGGSFNLTKNGPAVSVQSLSMRNQRMQQSVIDHSGGYVSDCTFPAAGSFPGGKGYAVMSFGYNENTGPQKLLSVFLPQRLINVAVDFYNLDGTRASSHGNFVQATLDNDRGTIDGTETVTIGGQSYTKYLKCQKINTAANLQWSCAFQVGGGGTISLQFKPKPSSEMEL